MSTITAVHAATVRVPLRRPIQFGSHVVRAREYVVSAVRSEGRQGLGFALTRDAPLALLVEAVVAPIYRDGPADEPERLFALAQATYPTTLTTGLGLRALSTVDLAAWDLAAQLAGASVTSYLGGHRRSLPAIALVGYPPTASAAEVAREVTDLRTAGRRRFKLPLAPRPADTRARLEAARAAAPDSELMLDAVWTWKRVPDAVAAIRELDDLGLAWIEDPLPPGDAAGLAAVRRAVDTPIAAGDEQGGGYFPEALLAADAVDVLRLDATCAGGVTTARSIVATAQAAGVRLSSHIFAPLHEAILCGLGPSDATVESGHGNDVDPLGEALVETGEPGFGFALDPAWVRRHELDDPHGIFAQTVAS